MAQNIHYHFKREEWEYSKEILYYIKTESLQGKQANPVALCPMSGTLPSKGLDGLTSPALLPQATAHSLVSTYISYFSVAVIEQKQFVDERVYFGLQFQRDKKESIMAGET